TLYAEGQRRYVESLSAYARQFLDQMEKPDVDFIEGLSPAIAIEQRSAGGNPRSTIATATEIYDYLRVLFSAVGQPHDPLTGRPLSRQTPQHIVDQILSYEPGTRIVVLAPLIENQAGEFRDVIEKTKREGFIRVRIDGQISEFDRPEPIRLKKNKRHTIDLRSGPDDFGSQQNTRSRGDHAMATRDEANAGILPPPARCAGQTFSCR